MFYGKLINGKLVKAPIQIQDNNLVYYGNIPDEIYRAAGYYLVDSSIMEIPSGKWINGWKLEQNIIKLTYTDLPIEDQQVLEPIKVITMTSEQAENYEASTEILNKITEVFE